MHRRIIIMLLAQVTAWVCSFRRSRCAASLSSPMSRSRDRVVCCTVPVVPRVMVSVDSHRVTGVSQVLGQFSMLLLLGEEFDLMVSVRAVAHLH